jgi:hypothetical protein
MSQFDNLMQNALINWGAPKSIFHVKPVKLESHVAKVNIQRPTGLLEITKELQLNSYQQLLSETNPGPIVFGISSMPDDEMAKRVALDIMYQYHKKNLYCPWHPIIGKFDDSLRDRKLTRPPHCLILTNVFLDSTPYKLELCRDILEMYSNIPRIIVTSGSNARDLVTDKLHFPLNGMLHLIKRKVR